MITLAESGLTEEQYNWLRDTVTQGQRIAPTYSVNHYNMHPALTWMDAELGDRHNFAGHISQLGIFRHYTDGALIKEISVADDEGNWTTSLSTPSIDVGCFSVDEEDLTTLYFYGWNSSGEKFQYATYTELDGWSSIEDLTGGSTVGFGFPYFVSSPKPGTLYYIGFNSITGLSEIYYYKDGSLGPTRVVLDKVVHGFSCAKIDSSRYCLLVSTFLPQLLEQQETGDDANVRFAPEGILSFIVYNGTNSLSDHFVVDYVEDTARGWRRGGVQLSKVGDYLVATCLAHESKNDDGDYYPLVNFYRSKDGKNWERPISYYLSDYDTYRDSYNLGCVIGIWGSIAYVANAARIGTLSTRNWFLDEPVEVTNLDNEIIELSIPSLSQVYQASIRLKGVLSYIDKNDFIDIYVGYIMNGSPIEVRIARLVVDDVERVYSQTSVETSVSLRDRNSFLMDRSRAINIREFQSTPIIPDAYSYNLADNEGLAHTLVLNGEWTTSGPYLSLSQSTGLAFFTGEVRVWNGQFETYIQRGSTSNVAGVVFRAFNAAHKWSVLMDDALGTIHVYDEDDVEIEEGGGLPDDFYLRIRTRYSIVNVFTRETISEHWIDQFGDIYIPNLLNEIPGDPGSDVWNWTDWTNTVPIYNVGQFGYRGTSVTLDVDYSNTQAISQYHPLSIENVYKLYAAYGGVHDILFNTVATNDTFTLSGTDITQDANGITVSTSSGDETATLTDGNTSGALIEFTTTSRAFELEFRTDGVDDYLAFGITHQDDNPYLYFKSGGIEIARSYIPGSAAFYSYFYKVFYKEYRYSSVEANKWVVMAAWVGDELILFSTKIMGATDYPYGIKFSVSDAGTAFNYPKTATLFLKSPVDWATLDPAEAPLAGLRRTVGNRGLIQFIRPSGTLQVFESGKVGDTYNLYDNQYSLFRERSGIDNQINHLRLWGAFHRHDNIETSEINGTIPYFDEQTAPDAYTKKDLLVTSEHLSRRINQGATVSQFTDMNFIPLLLPEDVLASSYGSHIVDSQSLTASFNTLSSSIEARLNV